jgi:hypothetical protein
VDDWFGGVEGYGWRVPDACDRTDAADDENDVPVDGTRIAFFSDYGATIPLWTDEGLLPEDPAWLERELGLSPGLISDLIAWTKAQDEADWRRASDASLSPRRDPEGDRQRLLVRLRNELAPRFMVVERL